MRITSLFIIASTLLSIVFALPAAVQKDQSPTPSSKHSSDVGSDDIPSLARRFEVEFDELLDRDISDLFRRARRKDPKVLPPKITFGKAARKDLDDLGLHGKERRKAKKYHKNIIKSHMKTVPGAHTADVA